MESHVDIEHLISAIEARSSLWDMTKPVYSDRLKKKGMLDGSVKYLCVWKYVNRWKEKIM